MALIDRPQFEQIRHQRLDELAALQGSGRKVVGYFCIYAPVEVIAAAGGIPVRLMHGGHAAEEAGEKYLRCDACSFCSSSMGNFELDPLYRMVDAVVAVNTCDMMRRLPEAVEQHFPKPVYQLYLPRTAEPLPHRVAEFRRQLDALAVWLGTVTGHEPDADRLRSATDDYNRLRRLLRQADDTRRVDDPLLAESTLLDLAATAWLLGPTQAESLVDSLLRIVWARPRQPARRPRLALGGSIVADDDRWLIEMVEQTADIVTDFVCTGTRWFAEDVERGDAPLEALARFYYSRVPCMHRRPNTALYDYARNRAADFRVQGLVYKTLLYCDPWNFEARRLQQALGLPMLHLDSDYSTENREQVRTRVEAFVETL